MTEGPALGRRGRAGVWAGQWQGWFQLVLFFLHRNNYIK